ncbi:phage tail protein [Gallaecimonas sp. GXIMD1310]|uniref:phage tail protein n=1 Tax=Gallaecimonas sp. GXIMD1310 TaxID=3131926 RepID=UPI0032531C92
MDSYIGEIRIFAGNFAPRDWALCDGQLLPISQNTALFSLLGTTYGGNGTSNFALPDLRGQAPMHWGNGPGLTPRVLGERAGTETVTLIESEMPGHNHLAHAVNAPGTESSPEAAYWAQSALGRQPPGLYGGGTDKTTMSPQALGVTGGGQPHNNMQPYQALNFIICLQGGEYPPRP